MASRPKPQKPILMKPAPEPKMQRFDLPADVAAQIIETIDTGSRKLQEVQAQLQAQVDAVVGALCSLEANRLKLPQGWRLSQDRKALEAPEAKK